MDREVSDRIVLKIDILKDLDLIKQVQILFGGYYMKKVLTQWPVFSQKYRTTDLYRFI